MAKRSIFILMMLVSLSAFSQKHEIRVGLNSGVATFRGNRAASETQINVNSSNVFVNDPLGKEAAFSYGVSANYRFVFRKHFFAGLDLGVENLRTKVNNVKVGGLEDYTTSGETKLNQLFVNTNPFVGYRIGFKNLSLDLSAGVDIASLSRSREKGDYKDEEGKKQKFENDVKDSYLSTDWRPRVQAALNFRRYTVYAGYSWGLENYYQDWDGGSPKAFLNVFRFGLQFRIW